MSEVTDSVLALAFVLLSYFFFGNFLLYGVPRRKKRRTSVRDSHLENVTHVENVVIRGIGPRLNGWRMKAKGNDSRKTVVLVHGWHHDSSSLYEHALLLWRNGFDVLAFDGRSHGDSTTALISYGPNEADDLRRVIQELQSMDGPIDRPVYLIAFSLGFSSALYLLKKYPEIRIRAVVLEGVFSSSFDVGYKLIERKVGRAGALLVGWLFFQPAAFVRSFGRFRHSRPIDLVDVLDGVPALVIRGALDNAVPERSALEFVEACKPFAVVWECARCGHMDSLFRDADAYRTRVIDFLEHA